MKLLLTSLFLLFGLFATVSAEQVTMEYLFEYPQVEKINLEEETFDRVVMKNVPNCGNSGQPALPARGAQILLPFGTDLSDIEIIPGERVSLGSGYYIEPVGKPVPLSSDPGKTEPPTPDLAIYNSDSPFPEARYEKISLNGFRGYQILTLKLQPMQYIPTSGELYYYPDLTVKINTVESDRPTTMLRGLPEDDLEIRAKVDNPEMADGYISGPFRGSKSYDLLIITTTSLAASFQPLKDYHDTTGLITEIHTTTEIGSSSPDDIRDYIYERYLNDGIQYVLIGADDDIIPAKDLYVKSDASGYYTEYNMPADVFFGCLDGTFNYDNDSYWGEPTDGEGGGDVDLIAEVYIGRASAGNSTEADRFVDKTIWYLNKQHANLANVVMVGEHLGFGGVAEYANFYMDELVDGTDEHGYTTVGIPSDQYVIDKLYDYDWPGNDWPQSELVTRINNGQHIVNHLGHGSPDYAMKMYNSDVMADLTNSDLCFVYSQTCLAGHLDGTDCWAEYMNIKTDHGAFGVVMNARYGFGEFSSTDGPSQRFNREFWDAVFSSGEGKPELGRANHDSKEDNLYRINEDCMRWCYYELNLFGDPSVAILGVTGLSFNYPNGVPELIMPGENASFEVVVTGAGDGIPVSGSGQLHYIINGGSVQTDWMTELSPNHYEAQLPSVTCDDVLEFYVSAEEVVNGRIFNPNPNSPFKPIIATDVVTVFADDFEADSGWTVSGGLWERGVPTGGGGQYGNPDPTSGHSGSNVFGYNLNGDYENSLPERHLTSPAIDCSEITGVQFKFWRWLGVETSSYDHAYVRVSNNGTSWTTIWENSGDVTDNSWNEMEYDISDIADNQPTVYIRFTMGTTDGSWQYCGWNIDDVELIGYECGTNAPIISTITIPDWTVDRPYSVQLEVVGGMGTITWSDKDNDLSGTGLTLSPTGLLSGTPTTATEISFTARVVDDSLQFDEQLFSCTINPSLTISAVTMPVWTEGIVGYSQQLYTSGGTGTKSWVDKNGDLAGTGLALSSSGKISGTPTSAGSINFTAMVSDVAGDTDEMPLAIIINAAVAITTDSPLPEAPRDVPFTLQLSASGGTGSIIWSDKNNDLSGTGLTLSSSGLLSGTPVTDSNIIFIAVAVDSLGSTDEKSITLPIIQLLVILSDSLPNWTIGNPYSFQMIAIGGVGVYTWADKNDDLSGSGLNLLSSGLLEGTPTDTGLISFTAMVTDEGKESTEKTFSLTINPGVEILTTTLPNWTIETAYSQQLEAEGGTGIISWSILENALFGTGLTLSATGLLSGMPIMAGTSNFTARAVDEGGDTEDILLTLTINDAILITTISLPEITKDAAYSEQLAATGGTGTLEWIDKYGSLSGTGLVLALDGTLSGTPLNAGMISLTAKATDNCGAFDEQPLTITVNEYLDIATINLPDWTINQPYSQTIVTNGGSGTKTWSDLNGDLEGSGLTLDSTGLLSGTPLLEGPISFTAGVCDECGGSDSSLFEFVINPAVSIITAALPDGAVEESYSAQLEATGGTGPLSWTDNGELDGTGLTFSSSGLLSGTPLSDADISFTAEISDLTGSSDSQLFDIQITLAYICGDINDDGDVNIFDATDLISYLYKDGSPPVEMAAADVNGDGNVDIFDITYLITFLYKGGPEPICN